MRWISLSAYNFELDFEQRGDKWFFKGVPTGTVSTDFKNELLNMGFREESKGIWIAPLSYDVAANLQKIPEAQIIHEIPLTPTTAHPELDSHVIAYIASSFSGWASLKKWLPEKESVWPEEYKALADEYEQDHASEYPELENDKEISWGIENFEINKEKALMDAPLPVFSRVCFQLKIKQKSEKFKPETITKILETPEEDLVRIYREAIAEFRSSESWRFNKAEFVESLFKISSSSERKSYINGTGGFKEELDRHKEGVVNAIDSNRPVPKRVALEYGHHEYVNNLDATLERLRSQYPHHSELGPRSNSTMSVKDAVQAANLSTRQRKNFTLETLLSARKNLQKDLDSDIQRYEAMRTFGTDLCSSYDLLMGYGPATSLMLKQNHITYNLTQLKVIDEELSKIAAATKSGFEKLSTEDLISLLPEDTSEVVSKYLETISQTTSTEDQRKIKEELWIASFAYLTNKSDPSSIHEIIEARSPLNKLSSSVEDQIISKDPNSILNVPNLGFSINNIAVVNGFHTGQILNPGSEEISYIAINDPQSPLAYSFGSSRTAAAKELRENISAKCLSRLEETIASNKKASQQLKFFFKKTDNNQDLDLVTNEPSTSGKAEFSKEKVLLNCVRRTPDGVIQKFEVEGYPTRLPEFEDIDFSLYQLSTHQWTLIENSTGLEIERGKNPQDCLQNSQLSLATISEKDLVSIIRETNSSNLLEGRTDFERLNRIHEHLGLASSSCHTPKLHHQRNLTEEECATILEACVTSAKNDIEEHYDKQTISKLEQLGCYYDCFSERWMHQDIPLYDEDKKAGIVDPRKALAAVSSLPKPSHDDLNSPKTRTPLFNKRPLLIISVVNGDSDYLPIAHDFCDAIGAAPVYLSPQGGFSKTVQDSKLSWLDADAVSLEALANQFSKLKLDEHKQAILLGSLDSRRRAKTILNHFGTSYSDPFAGTSLDNLLKILQAGILNLRAGKWFYLDDTAELPDPLREIEKRFLSTPDDNLKLTKAEQLAVENCLHYSNDIQNSAGISPGDHRAIYSPVEITPQGSFIIKRGVKDLIYSQDGHLTFNEPHDLEVEQDF